MAILGFSFRILTKSRIKIKVNLLDNYKRCIYHHKKLSICIKIFKVALFVAKIESKLQGGHQISEIRETREK